jgi:hypothetical protein
MALSLTGSGFVENIYHLLWSKDLIQNTNLQINLPDTIIYKCEHPYYWYFTGYQFTIHHISFHIYSIFDIPSGKDGYILRKNAMNVTNEEIKERFLSNISPSGIVAVYMRLNIQMNPLSSLRNKNKIIQKESQMCGKKGLSESLVQDIIKRIDEKNARDRMDPQTIFEFFDEKSFSKRILNGSNSSFVVDFLDNRRKPFDGTIQKFVDPVHDQNS